MEQESVAAAEPGRLARRVGVALVLVASVAAVAGVAYLRLEQPARAVAAHALLAGLPLAAALACALAATAARPPLRPTWWLLAAAAAAGGAGQLVSGVPAFDGIGVGDVPLPFLLFFAFHPLFAAACVYALGSLREPGAAAEIGLDALLVVAAGAAAILRFVWEPLDAAAVGAPPMKLMLGMQVASLGSLVFAALLLLWRETVVPTLAAAPLLLATALFAVGNILAAEGVDPAPLRAGDPAELVWLAGWMLMGLAPVAVWAGASARGERRPLAGLADRLPRVLVPAAAVLLAAFGVDAVRRPLMPATGTAVALVALLLAARTTLALDAARRRRRDRRRLADTSALIEVSHSLAEARDEGPTLDTVVKWSARLVGAPSAGVELITEDGGSLRMAASWNLPEPLDSLETPLEGSSAAWVLRHGPRATSDAASDPLLGPAMKRFLGATNLAVAPLHFRGKPLGALFACGRATPFDQDDLDLLQALGEQAAVAIENARLFQRVLELSLTDPLTGLANRRRLENELAREFAAARRGRRIAAVMFDLDNFKQYNDTHGHAAGDRVLCMFGDILKGASRAMNLAVRWGGDEFFTLLADCDRAGAEVFISRVRQRFSSQLRRAGVGGITVSSGVAEYEDDMDGPEDLVRRADQALYTAKAGRAAS